MPYELAKDQVEQFIFQRIEAIEQNVHRQQQVRLEQQQAQQDNYCKGNTEEMIGDLSNQVIILRRQLGKARGMTDKNRGVGDVISLYSPEYI